MDKNNGAIYDARKLGKPKMIILGVQHMFAMFGATILVPILTGLDISTTLLMAGLGTLLCFRSKNVKCLNVKSILFLEQCHIRTSEVSLFFPLHPLEK